MDLALYINKSKENYINKVIEQVGVLEIQSFEDLDIINPSLILMGNLTFNYCYVEKFKRYYYVTDIIHMDGNRMMVKLQVDVLMSHKDVINKSLFYINKSSNNIDYYYKDDTIPLTVKKRTQIKTSTPQTTWFGSDKATEIPTFFVVGVFAGAI